MRFALLFLRQPISKIIAVWLLAWLFVVGVAIYLLPDVRVDRIGTFHIISTYYFFCALVGGYFYRVTETAHNRASFRLQFLGILLFSAALIGTCLALESGYPVRGDAFDSILRSRFYFPLFKGEILLTKFFDISFQQVFIVGVLSQFKKQRLSDRQAVCLFSAGFFLLHLPLAFSIGMHALYFILPSLIAGIIFSSLILKVRHGLFASFAVHFSFYFFIGLWLRLF